MLDQESRRVLLFTPILFSLILESFKISILDVDQVKVSVQCTSHTPHHVPQYTWPVLVFRKTPFTEIV